MIVKIKPIAVPKTIAPATNRKEIRRRRTIGADSSSKPLMDTGRVRVKGEGEGRG